jgi:hypothetical protein
MCAKLLKIGNYFYWYLIITSFIENSSHFFENIFHYSKFLMFDNFSVLAPESSSYQSSIVGNSNNNILKTITIDNFIYSLKVSRNQYIKCQLKSKY